MELGIRCPECGTFLEGFEVAVDDHPDYKRGEFVVVCYHCRTPDGGLQIYDFRCRKCEQEFYPRILQYKGYGHVCPDCDECRACGPHYEDSWHKQR